MATGKITTAANGDLVHTATALTTDLLDGVLGITKFMASNDGTYYNGNVVAIAQGSGVLAGMWASANYPKLNVFKAKSA